MLMACLCILRSGAKTGDDMTKSKKQREKEANAAHERNNLITLGLVVAAVLITFFVLAG